MENEPQPSLKTTKQRAAITCSKLYIYPRYCCPNSKDKVWMHYKSLVFKSFRKMSFSCCMAAVNYSILYYIKFAPSFPGPFNFAFLSRWEIYECFNKTIVDKCFKSRHNVDKNIHKGFSEYYLLEVDGTMMKAKASTTLKVKQVLSWSHK